VTHHLEEIPAGFTHALILADGRVAASGPIGTTLTGEALTQAYGVELAVETVDGRFWARAVE